MAGLEDLITQTFRQERSRILASLMKLVADVELAEDCLAEAVELALERWRVDGVPHQPGAWLTTVARRKALDRLRRERVLDQKLPLLITADEADPADHRLSLIFTCCHPALDMDARVALTLRTLGGLTTAQVARAFLVQPATMAQRIVRAQRKIRDARIPYAVPPPERLEERLDGVLATLYLVYNEGWRATEGDTLSRVDIATEAIALTELLVDLMPAAAEPLGLLALMWLTQSRSDAWLNRAGEIVTLAEQDRTLWNPVFIERGVLLLDRAMRMGQRGPYQIQAAIACLHARAASAEATDWRGIAALYDALFQFQDTPVIALNRAVAHGMAWGPHEALALLAPLSSELDAYAPYYATRGEFMARLENIDEAADNFRRAIELEQNGPLRNWMRKRLLHLRPL